MYLWEKRDEWSTSIRYSRSVYKIRNENKTLSLIENRA